MKPLLYRSIPMLALALAPAIFFQAAMGQNIDIYVSNNGNDAAPGSLSRPVKTLSRAKDLLDRSRNLRPSTPVSIMLRKGTYYLDSPLVFTPKDNEAGDGPVVFQPYRNEKVTISGGRRLHLKWKRRKNGIYEAKVAPNLGFDQLFVNAVKQVRARYPNDDPSASIFDGVSRNALSPQRIRRWKDPAAGIIHALQKYHWGSLSYVITGKSGGNRLRVAGGYQINRSREIDSNDVFVENIREELDTAHEWYMDSSEGTLYYMPPAGMDLATAKIEVPVLTELIILKGTQDTPVCRISFKHLTFTHTKETFMFTREPLLRGDWNIFRGGAVLLSGATHCTFDGCDFESPGGNAAFFNDYNRYDTVSNSVIRNAGASGICFVGDPLAVRSPSFSYDQYVPYKQMDKMPGPRGNNFPKDCYVYDNLICSTGRIEKQTAGVELAMCMDISIVHNTIYHVPRAGINVNDGTWGGHYITDNDVFETVLETGDHGAFNSWGRDRYWSSDRSYMDSLVAAHPELVKLDVIHPIVLRHNRFRCDHGWDIDLDDGSSNYIIDSNLCLHGGIKKREGFYRTVENNIMVDNTFHPHVWFKNSHEKFMHNIVMRAYAPIGVSYWGDSIDYNLFPDSASLKPEQAHGTDLHSTVAFPQFYDPAGGDYRVKMDPEVRSTGFENFSMNDFGVVSPRLRAMARHPAFPVPVVLDVNGKGMRNMMWEGAVLTVVHGIDEQSALGLPKAEGVYVRKLSVNAPAYKKGLRENDVILRMEGMEIRSLDDLTRALTKAGDSKNITLQIYRDQRERPLVLKR